jgi:hypothetical protein
MGDRRPADDLALDVESAQPKKLPCLASKPIEEAGYEVFTNISRIGHCNGASADR